LLEKTFSVPQRDDLGTFPTSVIILSSGPDVIRTVYRHKETGLLVDPGGIWLARVEEALGDVAIARWFRDNFTSCGLIQVEEFYNNLARIISVIREEVGAHVIVMNTLDPEPRGLIHNYQFVRDRLPVRRREFNLALIELSRKLDFSIVDMDRTLQRFGIRAQEDWAHAHTQQHLAIGQEVFRVMQDLAVF
jgi:hypothetical protein